MRERLGSLPAGLLFVYFALTFGVGLWLIDLILGRPMSIALAIFAGLFFSALMTPWMVIVRRRSGGAVLGVAIARALKTGSVPSDIDHTVWLDQLKRRRARVLRFRWLGAIEFGLFTLLGLGVANLSPFPQSLVYLGIALLMAGYLVYCLVAPRFQVPRIDALRRSVEEQALKVRPTDERAGGSTANDA